MLGDHDVEAILIAVGEACRHRKRPLRELDTVYANKLRRNASNFFGEWCLRGVPSKYWAGVVENCAPLVHSYQLAEAKDYEEVVNDEVPF